MVIAPTLVHRQWFTRMHKISGSLRKAPFPPLKITMTWCLTKWSISLGRKTEQWTSTMYPEFTFGWMRMGVWLCRSEWWLHDLSLDMAGLKGWPACSPCSLLTARWNCAGSLFPQWKKIAPSNEWCRPSKMLAAVLGVSRSLSWPFWANKPCHSQPQNKLWRIENSFKGFCCHFQTEVTPSYLKILWDCVCGGAWANLLQVLLEPPLRFWFSWACPTQSSRLVCCVERAESNRSSGGWQCFQKAEPGKWDKGAKSVSLFQFQIVLSSIWICTCCASEKVWWCCCTPFQDWSVGFNCLHHSFSGIFAVSCGWQAAQQIYVLWTHQTRFVLGKDLISQTCTSCHVMSIKEPIQPTDKPTTYYFNQSMIEW